MYCGVTLWSLTLDFRYLNPQACIMVSFSPTNLFTNTKLSCHVSVINVLMYKFGDLNATAVQVLRPNNSIASDPSDTAIQV